jgi:hypothetical protein
VRGSESVDRGALIDRESGLSEALFFGLATSSKGFARLVFSSLSCDRHNSAVSVSASSVCEVIADPGLERKGCVNGSNVNRNAIWIPTCTAETMNHGFLCW